MTKPDTKITEEVVKFVDAIIFDDFPTEALRIGERCVLDGLGLMLAGSAQDCTRIVREFGLKNGQGAEATVFSKDPVKLNAPHAALVGFDEQFAHAVEGAHDR